MLRPIIEIDEEKCDGCGQCILNCAEGALAIVNGKARLISDMYCDGLGACLACPQGALRIVEREAEDFNEEAALAARTQRDRANAAARPPFGAGCPGSAARTLTPLTGMPQARAGDPALQASLSAWPVQLRLVPPVAPFLRNARVLLAAHCAGFALPDLHRDWIAGRIPVIACPKLEDNALLVDKLTALLRQGGMAGLDILRMSVPCCGLDRLTARALAAAGSGLAPRCHVVRL